MTGFVHHDYVAALRHINLFSSIYDTLERRFLTDFDPDFDRVNAGCRGGVEVEKHPPSGGSLSSAQAI